MKEIHRMKNRSRTLPVVFFVNVLVLSMLACNVLMSVPANTDPPSLVPPSATSAPLISQQVILVPQALSETNQNPPFTINAQTPTHRQ